jgi:hypothetical protein
MGPMLRKLFSGTESFELCQTKTFSMALLILSGRAYDSLKLADQKKILLKYIDKPVEEFFRRRSK